MKKRNLIIAITLVGTLFMSVTTSNTVKKETTGETEKVVMKAGFEMCETQTPSIVGVAAGNDDFSTLVAAVKAAELVDVLNSDGPFTVFAPTNAAFSKLPEGTIPTLLKPENKEKLSGILTYHVISGNLDAAAVIKAITDNNGSYTLKTVQGGEITAMIVDGKVILKDTNGNTSTVVMTDIKASNGVIHAIDAVVMPK